MKRLSPVRSRCLAAATFLVAGSAMNRPTCANPTPQSSCDSRNVRVAAVDITQAFRCHPGYLRAMDELKYCRAALAGEVAAARRDLHEARRRLATLDPASEAYRIVEAKITRREAAVRQGIERAKGELREQEARIYEETFDALVDTVTTHAKVREVALV